MDQTALLLEHLIVSLLVVNLLLMWNPSTTASSGMNMVGDYVLPNIPRQVYAKPGDINIGAMMILHQRVDDSGCIGNLYPGSWAIEYPESVAFAVDLVNRNPKLLPNVTLGFYLLDDCTERRYALAQALTFLPRNELVCTADICNNTAPSYVSSLSSAYTEQPVSHYDVVGILAPILSTSAVPVSYLLSMAKMPLVGYTTTTDELSDKVLHPTFLRVVTADKYQAIAMLEFISANGWSYISVVYSQGSYGESAFNVIQSKMAFYNICIATSHRVTNDEDMDPVAKDLLNYPRARAVILFADEKPVRNLFGSIEKLNATGRFIWVCCDSVTVASREALSQHMGNSVGAFMFIYNTVKVQKFYEYIRQQDVTTSLNPWFKFAWEDTFKCSFASGTCNANADITRNINFGFQDPPSLAMDAVLTFAHGIHNLMSDLCPDAIGQAARDCVKRDTLLRYLRNVSFSGFTGHIKFDDNYDYYGKYIIYQLAYDFLQVPDANGELQTTNTKGLVNKKVAYYDTSEDVLSYTNESIRWDHLLQVERVIPLTPDTPHPEVPEAVCSRPCELDEYKIQKELVCCWECRKCRNNERLINGNTGCEICEKFTWPDPATAFTTCRDIPVSYPKASDTLPVIEISLAVLAIIGTFLVVAAYIYYRETRVMKAASRELSVLQLCGIFVGYITVILFQTTPTPTMCTALYFMFCLSFAWLYSPLLIKAIRIYRIFQSGKKNNRRPRFISPKSQVFMSSLIILSQVILCLAMYILFKPTATKSQPVLTENFVELSCDMTLPGLASFLAYNIILVSLCAVFAFKTRKLPDNFNESKFISMCVYTTLVIWLAFIPTYFTASREFVKVLLLSVALLLNHSVALVFLFVPKIYAIMYVPDENVITNRIQTGGTGMDHNASGSSNRVAPTNGPPKPGFLQKE